MIERKSGGQVSGTETEIDPDEVSLNHDLGVTVAFTSRQGYNTGHGDFCFGRLIDRKKKSLVDPSGEDIKWFAGITGSNGVPVVELDDFQR